MTKTVLRAGSGRTALGPVSAVMEVFVILCPDAVPVDWAGLDPTARPSAHRVGTVPTVSWNASVRTTAYATE